MAPGPLVAGAGITLPLIAMAIAAVVAAGAGVVVMLLLNELTDGSGPLYSAVVLAAPGP